MSHKATHWAFQQRGLTPGEKWCLVVLADHHNEETGLCFPSRSRLAEITGISERNVKRHIKSLRGQGYINETERAGRSSIYDFNWRRTHDTVSPPADQHPVEPDNTGPTEGRKSTHDTVSPPDPGHDVTGDTVSPHPGHDVTPPMTPRHPTHDTVSPEPGSNRECNREGKQQRPPEFDPLTWEPDQRTRDYLEHSGVKFDQQVLVKFRLHAQAMGYPERVMATRLTSWLQGEKHRNYTTEENPGSERRREEQDAGEPVSVDRLLARMEQPAGGVTVAHPTSYKQFLERQNPNLLAKLAVEQWELDISGVKHHSQLIPMIMDKYHAEKAKKTTTEAANE